MGHPRRDRKGIVLRRTRRTVNPTRPPVLVVTLDAYKFSTRARKSAAMYARLAPTTFLGLAAAGRAGRWDEPGEWTRDGVNVIQLPARRPWTGTGRHTQIANLILVYIPALIRLTARALTRPADVIHATGIVLGPVGALHVLLHGSRMVYDITERPGRVSQRESLASLARFLEPAILKLCRRFVEVTTVVTAGDLGTMRQLSYANCLFVPNAPLANWRAPYRPSIDAIGDGILRLALVGTIFEGRGYELVLGALSRVRAEGIDVKLRVVGRGRPAYEDTLRRLAESYGISAQIRWIGAVESGDVSAEYLKADVGLVLYESYDPGNDGLSNKLMECVTTGRPVIATDLPENRRFMKQYRVGWLSDSSINGLADAIKMAARHRNLRTLSDQCRALGDTELTWEKSFACVTRIVVPETWWTT